MAPFIKDFSHYVNTLIALDLDYQLLETHPSIQYLGERKFTRDTIPPQYSHEDDSKAPALTPFTPNAPAAMSRAATPRETRRKKSAG